MTVEEKALALPESREFLEDMSREWGTDARTLWAVVKRMCLQPDKQGREATDQEVIAFLLVCREKQLNPLLKEAYGFLSRGRLCIGVGIDGWLKIANRHPEMDGISVVDIHDADGVFVACEATVWRKDRRQPFLCTEYLDECKQDTDTWRQKPRRSLRHKATIQALRYAFAITGIQDIEEARAAALAQEAQDVPLLEEPDTTAYLKRVLDVSPLPEPNQLPGVPEGGEASVPKDAAETPAPESPEDQERTALLGKIGALAGQDSARFGELLGFLDMTVDQLQQAPLSVLADAVKEMEG